jgi:hypothetical protein
MKSILDDVIRDYSIDDLKKEFKEAKIPIYLQLLNRSSNKWRREEEEGEEEKDTKSNIENDPQDANPSKTGTTFDLHPVTSTNQTLLTNDWPLSVKSEPTPEFVKTMLPMAEFQRFSEMILSQTLFNIMQESNAEAFDVSQKPPFLQLSPIADNKK